MSKTVTPISINKKKMTRTEIHLNFDDHARSQMYDELCERFGENEVHDVMETQVIKHLTRLYDNQDKLAENMNGNI